jgi:hypothetical protein
VTSLPHLQISIWGLQKGLGVTPKLWGLVEVWLVSYRSLANRVVMTHIGCVAPLGGLRLESSIRFLSVRSRHRLRAIPFPSFRISDTYGSSPRLMRFLSP